MLRLSNQLPLSFSASGTEAEVIEELENEEEESEERD